MNLPERKSHRLKNYDYSQSGYYFITVCTAEGGPCLATVGNAVPGVPLVKATAVGQLVLDAWNRLSQVDCHVETDHFCLMPSHIHGIVVIRNQPALVTEAERRGRRSLQDLVRGLKSVTTREYYKIAPEHRGEPLWQPSFYDKVIRSETMLYEVRKYIDENPLKWRLDGLHESAADY